MNKCHSCTTDLLDDTFMCNACASRSKCVVCDTADDVPGGFIFCEDIACVDGAHVACMPQLNGAVPAGTWLCPECVQVNSVINKKQ